MSKFFSVRVASRTPSHPLTRARTRTRKLTHSLTHSHTHTLALNKDLTEAHLDDGLFVNSGGFDIQLYLCLRRLPRNHVFHCRQHLRVCLCVCVYVRVFVCVCVKAGARVRVYACVCAYAKVSFALEINK